MTPQPTLAAVPGILLRTVLRTVARVLYLLANITFIATVTLALAALFLATWRSARGSRTQAATYFIEGFIELYKNYKKGAN